MLWGGSSLGTTGDFFRLQEGRSAAQCPGHHFSTVGRTTVLYESSGGCTVVSEGGGRGRQEVVVSGGGGQRPRSVLPGLTHVPLLIGCLSTFPFTPLCLQASPLGFSRSWIRRGLLVKDPSESWSTRSAKTSLET